MTDLTITRAMRHADYAHDVYINGLWVASAKNYSAADDLATQLWQEISGRIIGAVVERMNNPHACQSCGDLTAADVCAACSEAGEFLPIDVDYAPLGFLT